MIKQYYDMEEGDYNYDVSENLAGYMDGDGQMMLDDCIVAELKASDIRRTTTWKAESDDPTEKW